ncbi:hypothetical protein CPB83DRAFT_880673 [Crepidotus variabilis]|uniref:Uncharacterized protein n=1 Tax=Crepidotus variabilis TaxID=179855 RepID=A0A9P6JUJ9_9AGAR|nr:hypothetical protein CPB83DRAFT_880673 [Crepidotus variabilis]
MSTLPAIETTIRRIQSEPQLQLPSPTNPRASEQLPQLPNQASIPSSSIGGSIPQDTQLDESQKAISVPDTRSVLTRVLAFFGFGQAAPHQRMSTVSVIWSLEQPPPNIPASPSESPVHTVRAKKSNELEQTNSTISSKTNSIALFDNADTLSFSGPTTISANAPQLTFNAQTIYNFSITF